MGVQLCAADIDHAIYRMEHYKMPDSALRFAMIPKRLQTSQKTNNHSKITHNSEKLGKTLEKTCRMLKHLRQPQDHLASQPSGLRRSISTVLLRRMFCDKRFTPSTLFSITACGCRSHLSFSVIFCDVQKMFLNFDSHLSLLIFVLQNMFIIITWHK